MNKHFSLKAGVRRCGLYTVVALLCISMQAAWGQFATSFTKISLDRGLSDNRILDICQDPYGFMWFATQNGLNRFDGYQIQRYFSGPGKGNLPANAVYAIFCTKAGEMLIGTQRGLARYNPLTDAFESFNFSDSLLQPLNNTWCTSMAEDSKGNLLVGTYSGLFMRSHTGNTWLNLTAKLGLQNQLTNIRHILVVPGDTAFITTQDKPFFSLQTATLQARAIPFTPPFAENCCHYMRDIERISEDELLVSFFALGVARYHMRTGVFTAVEGPARRDPNIFYNSNYAVKKDSRGTVWTGSYYHALSIFNPAANRINPAYYNPANLNSYYGQGIDCIYEDRQGNLWIGTLSDGVFIYKPYQQSIRFHGQEKGATGYTSGRVRHIMEGNANTLYIAGEYGLSIFNRSLGTYTNLKGTRTFQGSSVPEQLNFSFFDYKGALWMGSDRLGIARMDKGGTSITQLGNREPATFATMGSVEMYTSTRISDTAFLITGPNNPVLFNPALVKFRHSYNDKRPLFQYPQDVNRLYWNESTGQLHGTTANGKLLLIHPDSLSIQETDFRERLGLPDLVFHALSGNAHGLLAMGTNKGILIISPADTVLLPIETGIDVLNEITGVKVTGRYIWFGNTRVVGFLDIVNKQYKLLGKKDGIRNAQFFIRSMDTLRNGNVVIGAYDGWYEIMPANLDTATLLNAPVVTAMRINNQPASLRTDTGYLTSRQNRYSENNLYFELSALDYANLDDTEYAYQLKGYDNTWQYAGTNRIVNYTNLPGGTYTFLLKARMPGGRWIAGQHPLVIEIAYPFWETWWFRLILLATIAGMVYAIYHWRVGQIRQKEKIRSDFEIKLNELENSALRTQMNPHFIFNSLNTINSFINRNEPAMANQYISKFSRLMRLILDHSREKKISLSAELDVLKLYVQIEQIRFENKFSFDLKISPDADIDNVQVPPLIIQPFAENAILHGLLPLPERGQLTLTIQPVQDFLQIVVEDNGVGRGAKKQPDPQKIHRKSHGMDITLKRIELFNKEHHFEAGVNIVDLYHANGQAAGTRVEIPLFREDVF